MATGRESSKKRNTQLLLCAMSVVLSACRPVPAAPAANPSRVEFTDATLEAHLSTGRPTVILTWSPTMPLSVRSLSEMDQLCRARGWEFVPLVPPAEWPQEPTAGPLRKWFERSQVLRSEAMAGLGVTLHLPSIVVVRGRVRGTVPGYHPRGMTQTFIEGMFDEPIGRPVASPALTEGEVVIERSIPLVREVGAYFKPVPPRSQVVFASVDGSGNYLLDLDTMEERRIPGSFDPVPTPDGRFLTVPGLAFYRLSDGHDVSKPVLSDPEMPDDYQTIGILNQNDSETAYRVMTSWRQGVHTRDYVWQEKDQHFMKGPIVHVCPERMLSLPMLAPDGRHFAAFDVRGGTTRLFSLAGTSCEEALDLGFATGKVAFSPSGNRLAFQVTTVTPQAPEQAYGHQAAVWDLKSHRVLRLSATESATFFFPVFLDEETLVLLSRSTAGGPAKLQVVRPVSLNRVE